MKFIFIPIFASVFILSLGSCGSNSNSEKFDESLSELLEEIKESDFNNVTVKQVADLYSIEIPSDLTISTSLNDQASLQYNNIYDEKYVIVIDEDKEDFIDILKSLGEYENGTNLANELANIQISSFGESLTISNQSKVIETEINGMNARLFAFDGTIPGIEESISYWTGYYVGEDNLYTVMAWTLKSEKSSFEKDANEILQSLKEL